MIGSLRTRSIVLALLVAASAAPAHGAEKALWGPARLAGGSSAFAVYDRLGIDTLQISLNWSDIAAVRPHVPSDPSDPAYRWPAAQDMPEHEAARHGIAIALRVQSSPSWANGGRGPIWAPDDPQDFADFLTAAARRYPGVRRWMIWDEPNRRDRFRPNRVGDPGGPRTYARLLDAAYAALKRASSHNRVIGGMTWTSGTVRPPDFLRWMRMPGGRRPRLDWFGHNPFPYRFPDIAEPPLPGGYRDISDVDTLSRELRRAYGRPVPLWLSEYTIQSGRGSDLFVGFVSRAAQARYVSAGFGLADDAGAAVAGLGWIGLLDQPPARGSANWGLMTARGERKPAFGAMASARSERYRPTVQVAPTVRRATLHERGLAIGVTPRASGPIVVELRRGGSAHARLRLNGHAGIRVRASLRAPDERSSRFTLLVRAPRGSTVRRGVAVHG